MDFLKDLDEESFCCSICLDLLKDPVTIPCGHSYCMKCLQGLWDAEEKVPSCPQCRKTFTPRPVLVINVMLAALVEQLKKTGLQAAPAGLCYENICSRHDEVMKMFCRTDQKSICYLCSVEEHRGHDTVSAAAERTEKQRELEESHRDVEQQIRSQQQTEVRRVKGLQEELEQDMAELKRRDAELKQLWLTEDHSHFLLNYPSLPPLSESTPSASIHVRPLTYFEDVTAAVSELRDKLQDILREEWTNISLTVSHVDVLLSEPEPEPKSRADILRYSRQITMDPNTANRQLLLSEENRKVTAMEEPQSVSDHPDRFTDWFQVLSRESLTGRCYWEVERRGEYVKVASWALDCFSDSFSFTSINEPPKSIEEK
uniref:Uncharacterized protein n=1 Tax=Oryzias latipes TaxID=8090 RepID=A0A3B3HSY3_ORYLA